MAFRTCPTCFKAVGEREPGVLYEHHVYASGSGRGRDQPHDMVPCETTDLRVAQDRS